MGLGGSAMEAAGQTRVVRAEDVAHMGLTEVVRHAPYIWSQYWKLVGSIRRDRPDVAILIDFPDVNLRLAWHLRRAGVPVLYFVSPQLWAWKRRRLRWVQRRVDRMLVIFPFEAAFYRARGVDAEFVGHPLAALPLPTIAREEYAVRYGLDPAERVDCAAAGQPAERDRRQPAEDAGGGSYSGQGPGDRDSGSAGFHRAAGVGGKAYESPSQTGRTFTWCGTRGKRCYHARAAAVASGTATVQALTLGNPFVVVYRVSALTFAVAKRMIRYPREIPAQPDADGNLPVGMVNLVAGRRIVPELLNRRFTAANLAAALRPLLEDGPERTQMMADLAEARARLLPEGAADPIGRVCEAVEGLLQPGNRARKQGCRETKWGGKRLTALAGV